MVVTVVSGGPSDQLGIQSGDRIVKIDDKNFAGIHITNDDVLKNLRGPGGTKVKVSILRRGQNHFIDFNIKRGKIPLYSVDVAYMLDVETGYIKISTFGETTYDDYLNAFMKLKGMDMKNLVLDLRGNPGGYLNTAVKIADEFLSDHKMIVYTKGRIHRNEEYRATTRGFFEQGKLIVLIDEGSASASEIVSGALQDWDRATIVGRRSFGKGLVQEENSFPDGSAIRLTIARYYTPTGRSIQKPYDKGYEDYSHELMDRIKKGELESIDSISFPDSLKFTTPSGHTVYGGGGIMPDVFVPLDTSFNTDFYSDAMADGLVVQFAYDYLDRNRGHFNKYRGFDEFNKSFSVTDDIYKHFADYAVKSGIKKNEQAIKRSSPLIRNLIKAYIARQLYKNDGFYPVIHQMDEALKKAMELMHSEEVSEK
jgi:carboxyl-terminal processing protease